jgi:hypothetical protein
MLTTTHSNNRHFVEKLTSFFVLEEARSIKFMKEDAFIREALKSKSKIKLDVTVLLRLL